MARTDILNWLGDVEASDEQIEQLERLASDLEDVYEDAVDRESAFTAGAQIILGDSTTQETVDEWKKARASLAELTVRLRGVLAVELQDTPETTVARRYRIARETVRKAAGK